MRIEFLIAFLLVLNTVYADGDNTTAQPLQCMPAESDDPTLSIVVVGLLLLGAGLLALHAHIGKTSSMFLFAAVFSFALALTFTWFLLEINSLSSTFTNSGITHDHADFAVMINNQLVDFTSDAYMSYPGHTLSRYVHLHHVDQVVHTHASGVTWDYFFKTLNIPMNDTCIDAKGTVICNATFLINGIPIETLDTAIRDGDRALFHYGTGNASNFFEQAVGNNSCLYSGTCPERGIVVGCAR